jgi:uncharacterized cupredoxin-like copper-binding protein
MNKLISPVAVSIIALMFYGLSTMGAQVTGMSVHNVQTQTTEHFPYGHPGPSGKLARVIYIKALDIRFEPKNVTVHRGETVKFVVTNDGKLTHEFVIGDAKLQAAHEKEMQAMAGKPMQHDVNGITVQPGQTKDLVWTFTRDGVTEFACHEPGHFAAGMVGKITIISGKHH